MKNLFLALIAFLITSLSYAQTEPDTTITDFTKPDKLKKEDLIIIEAYTDIWQNTPAVLKTKTLNRGYNFYFLNDNPLGKSNFSIAYGIGVSAQNMYSNCMPFEVLDTAGAATGKTEFIMIPDNIKYSKNKLTLFYADIPVEFRFRTMNAKDNFKIAIGFKAGYLVQSHTKYKGDRLDNIAGTIKYKVFDIPNIEKLRYGVTARIGFGRYNISGYYSLTTLFGSGVGPEMFPISVGIAVAPF